MQDDRQHLEGTTGCVDSELQPQEVFKGSVVREMLARRS
jgi:hypothetical protein